VFRVDLKAFFGLSFTTYEPLMCSQYCATFLKLLFPFIFIFEFQIWIPVFFLYPNYQMLKIWKKLYFHQCSAQCTRHCTQRRVAPWEIQTTHNVCIEKPYDATTNLTLNCISDNLSKLSHYVYIVWAEAMFNSSDAPIPLFTNHSNTLVNTWLISILSHWGIMYKKQPVSLMVFNEPAYL